MTRQEITVLCKDTLGEFLGAPGSDDPFAWDRLIDTAAADVCRATDCFSLVVGADVARAPGGGFVAHGGSFYRTARRLFDGRIHLPPGDYVTR